MSTQGAKVWKDFYTEFSKLANEEAVIVRDRMRDDYLNAYCSYERGDVVLHDRANPERGHHCLLQTPECGIWNISDGTSESFHERFRTLAARAGFTLGCPEGTDLEDFWLHSLFQDLLENSSRLLFAAKRGEGGIICRICEASATFCARLERKALGTAVEVPAPGKPTPLERLAVNQSDTEWALRFGTAWKVIKGLRQVTHSLRSVNTPQLVNQEDELIEFLWNNRPDIAKELELREPRRPATSQSRELVEAGGSERKEENNAQLGSESVPDNFPANRKQMEIARSKALKTLFSGRGYYEEARLAVGTGDAEWIRQIVKKQFAQIHDREGQAKFLRGYGQLFPDIAAEDPWYKERLPLISILEQSVGLENGRAPLLVSSSREMSASGEPGTNDLGRTIDTLYDELKRLKAFARGRRKTETELRSAFPNLNLWGEVGSSDSLPKKVKEQFFSKRLDSYGQPQFMNFIGNIIALEGDTVYKTWKKYRKKAGLTRKRNPAKRSPKSAS